MKYQKCSNIKLYKTTNKKQMKILFNSSLMTDKKQLLLIVIIYIISSYYLTESKYIFTFIIYISCFNYIFEIINESIEIINDKHGCEYNIYTKMSKDIIGAGKSMLSFLNYIIYIYIFKDTKKKKIYNISILLIGLLHNINF
mgnify:CR=1 FL=1|jgi:diacylglycerol kinase